MSLLFDMPFEELKQYAGRNPKPVDFDAFWDESLAEMQAVDPQVELVPADFQTSYAECFHLYFTGVGDARIHAKYVRPKRINKPCPGILHFHGYTGSILDWADEMKLAFAADGFVYAGLDCRGQGGMSEDNSAGKGFNWRGHIIRGLTEALDGDPKKLLYRQLFLDTAQLAKIIMEMQEVDENQVAAWGRSQGGALTVACAALEPRIKRLAPIYPFLTDYKRVWEIELAKGAYEEIQDWFRRFDPMHQRENEIFTVLGYIDIQHLAPRIRGDVLWSIGLTDTVCPPSSQFAAYNKITAKKSLRVYPDYGHEWDIPGLMDAIYQFLTET